MRRAFFTETAEEEREKRRIVPVSAEVVQEEKRYAEEEKVPVKEAYKKEGTQTEPVIDIEGLMRQMTKKLWEERESCGRRLR